jgi:hypothetical protein
VSAWVELVVYAQTELAPFDATVPDCRKPVALRQLQPVPRPGMDTALHGATPEVVALVESASHAYAIRLRVEMGLLDAQRALADVLTALLAREVADALGEGRSPHAIVVIDLFALDARLIEDAAVRLRGEEAHSQIWIALYPREDDSFDMESFGLRKLGLRELHVPAVAQRHTKRVAGFLNDVASYAASTGAHIKPGDAVSFGWVDVRQLSAEELEGLPDAAPDCAPRFLRDVVAAEVDELPGVLVVFEPESDADDAPLRVGVERAARIVEQMEGAARQCGLDSGVHVPRANATAVVCDRVKQGPPIEARRLRPDEPSASGWVAVCAHADHDHEDAGSFEVVALKWLATWAPRSFAMLAAPTGTGLTVLADGQMTIRLPEAGSDEAG